MHANNVPRAPIRVEHCGTRGTFSNVRLAASVVGLMFVLLIVIYGDEIMSIHKECPACHTPQSEIDQTFEELGIDLNDLLPCVCSGRSGFYYNQRLTALVVSFVCAKKS